jgi:hypothetical protein
MRALRLEYRQTTMKRIRAVKDSLMMMSGIVMQAHLPQEKAGEIAEGIDFGSADVDDGR